MIMLTLTKDKKYFLFSSLLFAVLSFWWLFIFIKGYAGETPEAELFSATYGMMALTGGVIGLKVSKKWGGHKSHIGKFTLLISLGLLAQEFGQISYSLYTFLFHTEIPYPSIGDVGYFGSVVLYIWAVTFLIRALRLKSKLTSGLNKLMVVFIPSILLVASYAFFLKGYVFDASSPLTIFLDFGYPLGQVLYISLALLALFLSRNYLGGIMKPVVLFLIFALLSQYISDFTFLYSVSRGSWQTGGINDYMYLISYFIMTIALLHLGDVINNINRSVSLKASTPVSSNG